MLRTRLIAGRTASLVLCSVFATLMTLTCLAEVLMEPLRVDPERPAPVTLRLAPATGLQNVPTPRTGITQPNYVVPIGGSVDDIQIAQRIRSYERDRRPPSRGTLFGYWVMYFVLAHLLLGFLRSFQASRGQLLHTQAGLLALIGGIVVLAKLLFLFTALPPYLVPVSAVPLWAALFLERRTALVSGLALSVACASLLNFPLPLVVAYITSTLSIVAVFHDKKKPIALINAGAIAGIFSVLAVLCVHVSLGNPIDIVTDVLSAEQSTVLTAFAGGALGGIFALLLQRIAIAALGTVSRARLLELTDLDQPLLKKMASEAPGSWEHSRAMANLAEGAAAAIGADALLTRVGAYYHDLGKTVQCKYFVENLDPGEITPHEGLDPDVSADAIMAHVVAGTDILRKGNIPEPVVEFAYTHHGTSVIEYFWHKTLEQGNPKGLTENAFRYPGMRPRSKETAILMIIDSIEAAARTVEEPSREKFLEIVQRVLFVKMNQGQLDEADLTVEDIRTLVSSITDTLCSAYHSRIKYPWQDRQERGEEQLPTGGVATEEDVKQRNTEA